MTNENYRKVESMLHNYHKNKAEIKNLKLDLEVLENDYRGIGSISYEERTQSTNAFSSSVENEIVKRDEKIIRLRNKIRLKEINIQKIDNALESLKEKDSYMIREYYLNKKQLKSISKELSLDENYSSTYKSKLIEILTNLIFTKEVT
ncbi:MAG: RNA polymerase subunit sigma [Clostridium sp.]|uniref:RNA polymerase subunit sigma n=1 Tax=Clostridium sp. TaxID=1506 RepID=UPI00302D85A2